MASQHRRRVTEPGFRPAANPEQAAAMREFGRSSAASPHTPAPNKGSRFERKRRAIEDSGNG